MMKYFTVVQIGVEAQRWFFSGLKSHTAVAEQQCLSMNFSPPEKKTLYVLNSVFEDRIISRKANVVWPLRSCDLNVFDDLNDFFLLIFDALSICQLRPYCLHCHIRGKNKQAIEFVKIQSVLCEV